MLVKISIIVYPAHLAFLICGSIVYKTTYSCILLFQCVITIQNTRVKKPICIFRGIAKHISLTSSPQDIASLHHGLDMCTYHKHKENLQHSPTFHESGNRKRRNFGTLVSNVIQVLSYELSTS